MNFLSFFDHRPSGVEAVRRWRSHYPAPYDWFFSGWHAWRKGEATQPVNPLAAKAKSRANFLDEGGTIAGAYQIDGYVSAMHQTSPKDGDGGARLHVLFTELPVSPGFQAEFDETREGGILVTHNAKCYARQIHIRNRDTEGTEDEIELASQEDRMLPHILSACIKTGSRVRLSGQVVWVEFVDPSLAEACTFRGFDDRVTCPLVTVWKWEHMPRPAETERAMA